VVAGSTDPTARQSAGTHPRVPIADPRIAALEAENAALKAENAAIKAALATSNAQNGQLQTQYNCLLAQADIFLEARNREIAELTKKCEKGVQLFNEGVKKYKELQSRNAELRGQVSECDTRMSDLESQLQQARDEIAQLRTHPIIDPETEQLRIWNSQWYDLLCNRDWIINCYEWDRDCVDRLYSLYSTFFKSITPEAFAGLNLDLDTLQQIKTTIDELRAHEATLTPPAIVVPVATPVSEAFGVPVSELPEWIEHACIFIRKLLISLDMPVPDFTTIVAMPLEDQLSMLDHYSDQIRNLRDAINTPLPDDDESAVEAVIPSDGMPSAEEIVCLVLACINNNHAKITACQRNIAKSERKPMHHAIFDTSIMPEYVKSLSRNDQLCLIDNVEKFFRQNCKLRHSAQEAGAHSKAKANAIKASITVTPVVARAPTPASNTSINLKVLNRGEIRERTPRPPNPPNGTPNPTKGSSA
jgi:hypothetical protein